MSSTWSALDFNLFPFDRYGDQYESVLTLNIAEICLNTAANLCASLTKPSNHLMFRTKKP